MPRPPARQPQRPTRFTWLGLAGAGVLVLVLGGLLLAALGAVQVLAGARVILTAEVRWSLAARDAAMHLQRYALLGIEEELADAEEALEYPRAARPVIRTALERPGDAAALEEQLRAHPLTDANIPMIAWLARMLGDNASSLAALRLWVEADDTLLGIEALAGELRSAVAEEGPGGERAIQIVERVHALDHELAGQRAGFLGAVTLWIDRLESRIRVGLSFLALLFLGLCGGLLFWIVRRTREWSGTLHESEARFRQVTESIHEVFWLTDPSKTEMLYVSPRFEEIWGLPVDELHRNPMRWMDAIVPDDRLAVEQAVPSQSRGDYDIEYRIRRPDGELRWIRDRAFPIRADDGRVLRVAGIAEDITRRKGLEAEIVAHRTLRSVGRMAGSVAHEFNNLLTVVHGHVEMALSEPGLPSSVADDLRAIAKASEQGASLTKQLLAISGRRILIPKAVELEHLFEAMRPMLLEMLGSAMEPEVDVQPGLPPARIDPTHFREAVLEAVENAANAVGPEGTVRIRALLWRGLDTGRLTAPNGTPASGSLPPEHARRIEVRIEDDGPGIAPEELVRVLEPFGGQGKDDGRIALGLPSVQGIMTQSGGELCLESEVGMGTTVRLFLPLWTVDYREDAEERAATSAP